MIDMIVTKTDIENMDKKRLETERDWIYNNIKTTHKARKARNLLYEIVGTLEWRKKESILNILDLV